MRICISTFLLLSSWLSGTVLFGQALPPGQPEQDCVNAIPVCNNVYTQPNSYQGAGQIPGEIDSTNSCLGAGEENDVWYIFTVQTPGEVCFTLTPANGVDDYDWAVYNLTGASCSDIFTQAPALEVACNFSGATGCGAITGPNGNPNCPAQNDPCIPVLAGETYVVNVSNYSGTGSGYTLDFSPSTAVIFDNIPPAIDTIQVTCSGALEVVFSENVLCSSVDVNDFLVTSQVNGVTYPVTTIFSDACALGGTFDQNFELQLAGSPPVGALQVIIDGTVTDNCGNAAILGIGDTTVLTNPLPVVNIAATDDSICAGEPVTLTVPDFPFASYTWSIAGTDTFQNISPLTTTEYWVDVVDTAGCLRTDTIEIFVRPSPDPTFTANAQVCVDSIADVVYQGGAGAGANFTWDFAGGVVQSGTGPGPYAVSFDSGGTYPISLLVAENGCSDSATVNVVVPPQPIAQLDLSPQICLGDTAQIGLIPPVSGTATFTWDFDGGVELSGSGAGPYAVDWLTPGSKNACVIVEESGCFSPPICATVQVNAPPGGSILNVAPQCLSGNEFSFVYQGSPSIQTYLWDLGEGGLSSNSLNPVVSYDTAGTKTISVIVTDANGCSSQSQVTAEVYPMPEANFAADTVCAEATTSFQDLSLTQQGHGLNAYAWAFGDGNGSDQISPNHLYADAGIYPVQLLVTSVDGCQDSITRPVPVRPNPVAAFSFGRYCVNQASSLTNDSEAPNLPVSYRWQFPDGRESDAFEPFFSDEERGEKPITLTVTNGFGCMDSYTDTLLVSGLPQAAFESDLTCEGEEMALRSTVQLEPGDSIASYEWLLGDGSQVEGEAVDYRYASPGRYLVTHKVETVLGCRDSVADSVIVWARPQAGLDRKSVV
jgi:PKD repeat protein